MKRKFTIYLSEKSVIELQDKLEATTMTSAIEQAIEYTNDSFRKGLDTELQEYLENIIQTKVSTIVEAMKNEIAILTKELEKDYIARGEIHDKLNEIKKKLPNGKTW